MDSSAQHRSPSEAAKRLGISTKALRHYEMLGLLKPPRTASGWRVYGPAEMARARRIVELRALGLGLADISQALGGEAAVLGRVLAAHAAALDTRAHKLHATARKVRELRTAIAADDGISKIRVADNAIRVAFDLPWPWDGERFEIPALQRLTYVTGPLGSGKTRLTLRMAQAIQGASFVGVDRLKHETAASKQRLAAHPHLDAQVRRSVAAIVEAGGNESDALRALFAALAAEGPSVDVVDMIEDGLDTATQEALMRFLRKRMPTARPLILLTRSSAILDVASVGEGETIVFCPANHSPPMLVAPHCGSVGYEALATCLATPAVRARTGGMVAVRRSA